MQTFYKVVGSNGRISLALYNKVEAKYVKRLWETLNRGGYYYIAKWSIKTDKCLSK